VLEYSLANHIIFILGAPTVRVMRGAGFRNFLSPLRASSIRVEDIKTVIFYVSRRFIEREWNTVASFPRVFVFAVCYFSFLFFIVIIVTNNSERKKTINIYAYNCDSVQLEAIQRWSAICHM